MRNRLLIAILLVATFALTVVETQAQTRARKSTQVSPTLMASLPESDAVAQVNLRRLLSEVVPRLLSTNPTKLAEVNSGIEKFKTRTGLDPRSFEQLALGIKYSYPNETTTKLRTVALANGTFSAGAMVAAGRIAANGKYREEKYKDRTIYVFTLDESVRLLGVFDFTIKELAACPLDSNTLALGDAASVRNVIDVNRGRKRGNAELIALANRDPNAVIGFGSNMSPQLLKNLDIPNASVANDLAALRQVYGAVGANERDLDLFIAAKTVNIESARNLGDTLEGLKQLGALFVGRLSGAKGILARSALSNLKIATQANELQIRTAIAQSDVAPLFGN